MKDLYLAVSAIHAETAFLCGCKWLKFEIMVRCC